jgi:cohesin complex subunit SA-1/2
MIKTLPKLFTKYKTDSGRIVDVLSIPRLIDLEIYLSMRVISVRANVLTLL